jgi:simple sugar transport system permease protein
MMEFFGAIALPLVFASIRISTPLIFASLGGMMSERGGVINIALEGFMLMGAFAAAVTAHEFSSAWLGFFAGIGAGVVIAALYGLFVIQLKADQIVCGTAVNLFAAGVIPCLSKVLYDVTVSTPPLDAAERFQVFPVILAWSLVMVLALWLRYFPSGLWLSFAGEHPKALRTAGINPRVVRWFGVLSSGALAGLGGVTLALCLSSGFSRNMTAGRGFMALAALIFGKWRPVPAALACLLFGFVDAVQIRLQGVPIWDDHVIPVQFIQILPYVVTVIILSGYVGLSRAPAALGTTQD